MNDLDRLHLVADVIERAPRRKGGLAKQANCGKLIEDKE
jgi:hypothetical protein